MQKRKYSVAAHRVDAGLIAAEVVRDGRSRGWSGSADAHEQIRAILEPFAIVYVDDFHGEWAART
jgi:hypothetical protein